MNIVRNSFNAGEWSPRLKARTDLEKYAFACETMENWLPLKYGGAEVRPGTEFIAEAKHRDKRCFLYGFNYSTDTRYVIEIGDEYFRFFKDGDSVLEAAVTVTSITAANPAVVTANAHGYANGDEVLIAGVSGMTAVNGKRWLVYNKGTNTFQLKDLAGTVFSGAGLTAGTGGTVKRVYEVAHPYQEDDLGEIQFIHLNDVLYMVHESYPPAKLSRLADASWTYAVVDFGIHPPWEDLNDDPTVTISPSATTGTVTLTASSSIFSADMVSAANRGTLIRIVETIENSTKSVSMNQAYFPQNWESGFTDLDQIHDPGVGAFLDYIPHNNVGLSGSGTYRTRARAYYTDPGYFKSTFRCRRRYKASRDAEANVDYLDELCDGGTTPHSELNSANQSPINLTAITIGATTKLTFNTANDYASGDRVVIAGLAGADEAILTGTEFIVRSFAGAGPYNFHITTEDGDEVDTTGLDITLGSGTVARVLGPFLERGVIVVPSTRVDGPWSFQTSGTWYGEWEIERSDDDGVSWQSYKTFTSANDKNFSSSGDEADSPCLLRLLCTKLWEGYADPVQFRVDPVEYEGFARITAYSSGTSVTAVVVRAFQSTAPSFKWSENHWSDRNGYPRAIETFENRVWYAGTMARPQTFWASVVGEYDNFRSGAADADALEFTLLAGQQNPIQWLHAERYLVIGTSGSEHMVTGGEDESITPTNIKTRRVSSFGSNLVQAEQINDVAVFVERLGLGLREMTSEFDGYGSTYKSADLTLLAEHILNGGLEDIAFRAQPVAQVYCVRGDGTLCVMVYERAEEVVAWARIVTDGDYESVATIYGTQAEDEVWVAVERTIDGVTRRYIERFYENDMDARQYVFTDAAVVATGSGLTQVSGLDHLEGETVSIVGDGGTQTQRTVTDGAVTISPAADWVAVGLPYRATLKPFTPEVASEQGSSRTLRRRIESVTLDIYQTLGLQVGTSLATLEQPPYTLANQSMDTAPTLKTEQVRVFMRAGWEKEQTVFLVQDDPQPATVLAIAFLIGYESN